MWGSREDTADSICATFWRRDWLFQQTELVNRTPYITEVQCLQMLGRMEWVKLWVALALRDTEIRRMSIEVGWWALGIKVLLWFLVPFALSYLLKFNIVHQAHIKAEQMDDITVFEGEEFCGYPRSFCQFSKYSCLLSLGECVLQNHNRVQSCGKYLLNSKCTLFKTMLFWITKNMLGTRSTKILDILSPFQDFYHPRREKDRIVPINSFFPTVWWIWTYMQSVLLEAGQTYILYLQHHWQTKPTKTNKQKTFLYNPHSH